MFNKMSDGKKDFLQNFFENGARLSSELPNSVEIFGQREYPKEIKTSLEDKYYHQSSRWIPELGSVWQGTSSGWAQPTQNPLLSVRQQTMSANQRRVDVGVIIKITESDPFRGLIEADVLWKYDLPSSPDDALFPTQHLEPVLIPMWGVMKPYKHDVMSFYDSQGAKAEWYFPDKNHIGMTYTLNVTNNAVNVSREKIIHPKLVLALECVRIDPMSAPEFKIGEVRAGFRQTLLPYGQGAREASLSQLAERIKKLQGLLGIEITPQLEKDLTVPPNNDVDWLKRIENLTSRVMRLELQTDPMPPNAIGQELEKALGKVTGPSKKTLSGEHALKDTRAHNAVARKDWGVGWTKGHVGYIPVAPGNKVSLSEQENPKLSQEHEHLVLTCSLKSSNLHHHVYSTSEVSENTRNMYGLNTELALKWLPELSIGYGRMTIDVLNEDHEEKINYTLNINNLSMVYSINQTPYFPTITFVYGHAHEPGYALYKIPDENMKWENGKLIAIGTWVVRPAPKLETAQLVVAAVISNHVGVRVSTPLNPEGETGGRWFSSGNLMRS